MKSHHSLKRFVCFCDLDHYFIFTEIKISVNNGMSEVPDSWISREYLSCPIVKLSFHSINNAVYFWNGIYELLCKGSVTVCITGRYLAVCTIFSSHTLVPRHSTKYHIRVIHKILIARNAVGCFWNVYPVWYNRCHCCSFFQKDNICCNTVCVFKRSRGKSYCA